MIEITIGGVKLLAEDVQGLEDQAEQLPAVFKFFKEMEQAAITAEVFAAKNSTATPAVTSSASTNPNGAPSCPHGVMVDLNTTKGTNYKHKWYCPADFKAADRCKQGRD